MSVNTPTTLSLPVPKFHIISSILHVYCDLSGVDTSKYLDVGNIDWNHLSIQNNEIIFRMQGEKRERRVPLLPIVTLDSLKGELSARVSNTIQ